LTSQAGCTKKTVEVNQRDFLVRILRYDNGNYISISERMEKIGTVIASINLGGKLSTATVIPSKSETIFLKMVSERVASITNGICIFSLNIEKDLDLDCMKVLMDELMEIIKY